MRVFLGIDLGSTTTKAVMLDERGEVLGRGITNSRSDYHLAADLAREDAFIAARFALLDRELERTGGSGEVLAQFRRRLHHQFRKQQYLAQLEALRVACRTEAEKSADGNLVERVQMVLAAMEKEAKKPQLSPPKSEFFRDRASSEYARFGEQLADRLVPFDALMGIFDKSIIKVEAQKMDLSFEANIAAAFKAAEGGGSDSSSAVDLGAAVEAISTLPLEVAGTIGTGYGRALLPFPKESIRSEILCHGLGAHAMFPKTRTVLDIGGQDTKAIQVDGSGIVTSFQMNDRCAAGCGRYLGYIADEMNLGLHELGPLAMGAGRRVKINSTCTVFAGAELRDRMSMGQRKEDILAGLHRSIILRAMALLARSGGVADEMTFTGGVASNVAAVAALKELVAENYGERVLNISPSSIYTGAYGAALFAQREAS
ncbi:MAG: BadF/BadG/BcrA/BcrD ATPase family protein [Myxococcota bacterium]